MNVKKIILVGIVSFVSCHLVGQVNFKVGYSGSFLISDPFNDMLDLYDTSTDGIAEGFGSLNYLNGVDIAVQYKWNNTALGLGWESMLARKEAIGLTTNNEVFSTKLNVNISGFYAFVEQFYGRIGLGATIGNRGLGIRIERDNVGVKRKIISESAPMSKFYLVYKLQESRTVSFALKPFVVLGWGEGYDLSPLESDLIGTNPIRRDPFQMVGLSLVFYNGRQR